MEDVSCFVGKQVVITVKMDGENSSLYADYLHARSTEYNPHPSRSWLKSLHARIAHDIPVGWRVCGENLWAKHSIHYRHLEDLFLVFSVWNDKNECLSWEQTKEWAGLLGLKMVPVLYEGMWDQKLVQGLDVGLHDGDPMEGYVVRVAESFHYKDFRKSVAKYVRKGHVQTHGHWIRSMLEPNKTKDEKKPL